MTEIEHLTGIIDDAKAKVRELEMEEHGKQLASNLMTLRKQFLAAGFTEEQAWQLVIALLKAAAS